MFKRAMALTALGICLVAQGNAQETSPSLDLDQLIQEAEGAGAQFDRLKAALTHENPSVRVAVFDKVVRSNDTTLRQLAVDYAIFSDDITLRGLALKYSLLQAKSFNIDIEKPEKIDGEQLKNFDYYHGWTWSAFVSNADFITGQIQGKLKTLKYEYEFAGQVQGIRISLAGGDCAFQGALGDDETLVGKAACGGQGMPALLRFR